MAGRRLDADEAALWRKVAETVRPLHVSRPSTPFVPSEVEARARSVAPAARPSIALGTNGGEAQLAVRRVAHHAADTLDGGWDRRLRRGVVEPDMTVDLHGHTLATAHAALDHALARATAHGVRVILLITGKPLRQDSHGRQRGLIRAAIFDWLAGSRFAGRIAAVRGAHPRHGGTGALYLILRRERTG